MSPDLWIINLLSIEKSVSFLFFPVPVFMLSNPTPGIIINRPNGSDVYHGVPKDYTKGVCNKYCKGKQMFCTCVNKTTCFDFWLAVVFVFCFFFSCRKWTLRTFWLCWRAILQTSEAVLEKYWRGEWKNNRSTQHSSIFPTLTFVFSDMAVVPTITCSCTSPTMERLASWLFPMMTWARVLLLIQYLENKQMVTCLKQQVGGFCKLVCSDALKLMSVVYQESKIVFLYTS